MNADIAKRIPEKEAPLNINEGTSLEFASRRGATPLLEAQM